MQETHLYHMMNKNTKLSFIRSEQSHWGHIIVVFLRRPLVLSFHPAKPTSQQLTHNVYREGHSPL